MTPDDPNARPPYTYCRKGRWFWEPPPRLRPAHKVTALGADQATAWTVARALNRALLDSGDAGTPGSVKWLLRQFEASDRFEQLAPSTRKDYIWLRKMLSAHRIGQIELGDLPAKAIKARHADKVHAALKAERGEASAHYACRYARRVWKWAGRQEHVDRRDNPWSGMELAGLAPRKQRWTRDQVEAFCAKATELRWPSHALAVRLAYWLSLRQADILALTWTALEAQDVETQKTGANVPAVVAAYPDLAQALAATKRTGVQVLICETTRQPWKEDFFRHTFRAIAKASGLPDALQFRDLRATAVTELADAGASDVQMSSHSGHLTADMRRRYARRTAAQFEGAAELRLAAEKRRGKGSG